MKEISKANAFNECFSLAGFPNNRYRYSRKTTQNLMAEGSLIIRNGVGYTIRCKSIGAGIYEVWAEDSYKPKKR